MRPSRREFLNWVSAGGIALSLSRLGAAEAAGLPPRASLPGRANWNPAANGAGRVDGTAKVTGAKLYASDFRAADLPGWPANTSHAMLIRAPDATHVYHRNGSCAARRRDETVGRGDISRSRQDRRPRSRILYRRPVLSARQDAALSGAAGRAVDLRDVRRLRSGAPRLARWNVREVRRGNRPRRHAGLWRLSLHARGGRDAGRARCLFADPGRLGQPGTLAELAASDMVAGRQGHRGVLRQGRDPWRTDPR